MIEHLLAAADGFPFGNLGGEVIVDDHFLPTGIAIENESISKYEVSEDSLESEENRLTLQLSRRAFV